MSIALDTIELYLSFSEADRQLLEENKVERERIEEEIKELKRQNEVLRGHVAEIYEIRDENERLRTQLRELK